MSQSASQAALFYREVAEKKVVWTIRDKGGFPAPMNSEGNRSQPFWSTRSRVEKIIKDIPAYKGFEPVEISWNDFVERWVPGLSSDKILMGINWSGVRATGYDVEPNEVLLNIKQAFL